MLSRTERSGVEESRRGIFKLSTFVASVLILSAACSPSLAAEESVGEKSKRYFLLRRQLQLRTKRKNRRQQKKNRRRLRRLRREKRNPSPHRRLCLQRRRQKRSLRLRRSRAKRRCQHRRLLFHQPQRQRRKAENAVRRTRLCYRKRSVVSRIIRRKCSNCLVRHSNSRPAILITNTAQPTQVTAEWIAPALSISCSNKTGWRMCRAITSSNTSGCDELGNSSRW